MSGIMTRTQQATRFPAGLYGVTPDWHDTDRLLAAVDIAARNGMRAVQLRRKNIDASARRAQALALQSLCRERGVTLVINDDWRLADDIGADCVHIGREDAVIDTVRAAIDPGILVGVSCYNDLALAERALSQGADYVAFGAVFPSSIKPDAVRADLDLFTRARALLQANPAPRASVVAIGGITPANCASVVRAGADSIALITGLFEAPDIASAARACARHYQLED